MSLRAFHIIFVIVTTLLSLFVALWGFFIAPANLADSGRLLGYIGIAGCVIMPIYGILFYQKVKRIIL